MVDYLGEELNLGDWVIGCFDGWDKRSPIVGRIARFGTKKAIVYYIGNIYLSPDSFYVKRGEEEYIDKLTRLFKLLENDEFYQEKIPANYNEYFAGGLLCNNYYGRQLIKIDKRMLLNFIDSRR